MTVCPRCNGSGEILDDRVHGASIRRQREALGLSLREVARRCGWSAGYLSDLELGRRSWGRKQIINVEQALGGI
mgnify:FL=1